MGYDIRQDEPVPPTIDTITLDNSYGMYQREDQKRHVIAQPAPAQRVYIGGSTAGEYPVDDVERFAHGLLAICDQVTRSER